MDSGDVIDLTGEPRQHKRPRRGARAPAASQPESPGSAGAAAGRPSAAAATPGRAAEAAAAAGAAAAAAPKPARGGGRQSAAGGGAAAGGGRKRQKKERQEKEKRVDEYGATVSWRPKASAAVQLRMERAMPGAGGHRLFLIDRTPRAPLGAPGGAAEEFAVLGATGNVYTVTIGRHPRCSCPDAGKGNVCKHRLFVLLRVLHLSPQEPLVWQQALLGSEADEILSGQKSQPRLLGGGEVLASEAVRLEFQRASTGGGDAAPPPLQRPSEGADCCVCFEPLQQAGQRISFCAACGNNVHGDCIGHWLRSQRQRGGQPSCPLCRAAWRDGSAPGGAQVGGGEGSEYVNLAAFSQPHRQADTSLEALYGDRALWIRAHQGGVPMGVAANMWRSMH